MRIVDEGRDLQPTPLVGAFGDAEAVFDCKVVAVDNTVCHALGFEDDAVIGFVVQDSLWWN